MIFMARSLVSTRSISLGLICKLAMISDAVAGTRTIFAFFFARDFRFVVAMRKV